MIAYPDTSFLCSVYRRQDHSAEALAHRRSMTEPLHFARLLEFEFLQAIELQVFLFAQDRRRGYSRREADLMLADWDQDVAAGHAQFVSCDTDEVIREIGLDREVPDLLAVTPRLADGDGLAVLRNVREDARFHLLPVVVIGARLVLRE